MVISFFGLALEIKEGTRSLHFGLDRVTVVIVGARLSGAVAA